MVELVADATAVKVTGPPVTVTGVRIERVFTSAYVDFNVQVETPEAFELEQAACTLAAPVFVALKVGVVPLTGLLLASFKVTVMVEDVVPSALTAPVPVIVDVLAEAGAAL